MKLLKITLILLFLIISTGFVSAQDSVNDTLETDIPTTEEAGSFSELENNINSANGTLEITKDYKNGNYSDGITINKDNLVINGNNHVFDGNGHRIFFNSGNLTLNNLIFTNSCNDRGGAIYNNGTLILNNVTFINNAGNIIGGAVYNKGSLILNNGTFINNTAGIVAGAVYSGGDMNLHGAVFVNNSADVHGGAIYNWGVANLSEVAFISNTAVNLGGAVYNFEGNMNLFGAVFAYNSVDMDGGAVCNDGSLILNNGTFINNTAVNGGAVHNSYSLDLDGVIFINNTANDCGGAVVNNGVAAFDNADFTDNCADNCGGAIFSGGEIVCRNSRFMDNAAVMRGSAIYLQSIVEMPIVDSCYFESKHANKSSSVFAYLSNLLVNNSIFINSSAVYAPAILAFGGSMVVINNTQFVNLNASKTAGAVAIKEFGNVTVENSRFINTSAARNGGALFIDSSDDYLIGCDVCIHNTSFINASGDFGGAYLQLEGNLTMSASTFVNCSSKYDGGAVYISLVTAEISDSTFISNENTVYEDYPTYGGAIYCHDGDLNVTNSKFANNSAYEGGGTLGIYDSWYHIENSTFDDGEAIHAIFKWEDSLMVNCSGNFTVFDDDVIYPQVVINQGVNFTSITNEINLDTLPIRFDLRDYNWIAPVKDQDINGACWAFATNAALESVTWRSSDLNDEYSTSHMQTSMLAYSRYGSSAVEGGNCLLAAAYLLDWFGPISEEYYPTDLLTRISPLFPSLDVLHIHDVVILDSMNTQCIGGDPIYKQAILKYGAIHVAINGEVLSDNNLGNDYYNFETSALYIPNEFPRNHAVCIVGWDDGFSADNFLITPPDDGAWICMNSHGTEFGDEGYFYVSYYDKTFAGQDSVVFLLENTISYNKNYQYDFTGLHAHIMGGGDGSNITYANRFISVDDDLLAAVGTYFNNSGTNYTVTIEVNGEIVHFQEGVSPYRGYHTIKLDKYIPIKKGDEFVVYVTSDALPFSRSFNIYYEDNVSMTDAWGDWIDINDFMEHCVACLKAYTVCDDSRIIGNENVSVEYASQSCFTVQVVSGDGHLITGAFVNFTINGKTESVLSDDEGIAGIEIDELPGSYVITTSYANQTYRNNVTVTLDLDTCKLVSNDVKVDYAGGSYFTVKVVSANGKVSVAGESVIIIFNGKTNTLTTDENGIAKIKITDVPKKYEATTIYNGKTYKNTVTVRQVLTTAKVTVKRTSKKFTLKAKLKINGKLQKGKTVTFKFNGKTYKAKTAKNGIAKVTIKKNVIKKLKKGKTYAVKVTYIKDTIKSSVKVR